MKAIDELIEKLQVPLISKRELIDDLEQLKAELKEQHKKDVVSAYIYAQNDIVNFYYASDAEQYYNENH